MKWKWNYGHHVVTLPAEALAAGATDEQMRVLLCIAKDQALADHPAKLAAEAKVEAGKISDLLVFWQSKGILIPEDSAAVPAIAKVSEPETIRVLPRADEIPNYSSTELAEMLEKRSALRSMVDDAQQILGKMCNTYEVNLLLGMTDYLGLDENYILLLLSHCRRIEISSMRAIERYAIRLVDKGICTVPELEVWVEQAEALHTLEGQVRRLLGMNNRSLTEKQKKMLETWQSYGYGEDVIRRAYETAADAIPEPTLNYLHSILERWHGEGLKTVQEIDRKREEEEAQKAARKKGKNTNSSFDTDDFYEAALRRTFQKKDEKSSIQEKKH